MGCEAQLAWKWLVTPTLRCFWEIFTSKVDQTDMVSRVRSEFISKFVMQDYTSLCVEVMICATGIQTHTHTVTSLYDRRSQLN